MIKKKILVLALTSFLLTNISFAMDKSYRDFYKDDIAFALKLKDNPKTETFSSLILQLIDGADIETMNIDDAKNLTYFLANLAKNNDTKSFADKILGLMLKDLVVSNMN